MSEGYQRPRVRPSVQPSGGASSPRCLIAIGLLNISAKRSESDGSCVRNVSRERYVGGSVTGGGGVNGGMSGFGLFWSIGSEGGSSGIGIFAVKGESLGQVSGTGKVTMIRVRSYSHLSERAESSLVTS